jgi:hypothetical protein
MGFVEESESKRQEAPGSTPPLAHDLTGDLPCIGCGYNLRGLSIRAQCPECGTAVRATILARVDPRAEELMPVRHPWLVAHAMILWAWAAVAAALLVWSLRLSEVVGIWVIGSSSVHLGWAVDWSLVAIALSGLGALALIRPVAGRAGWDSFKAAGAVLTYLPLLYVHHQLHARYDAMIGTPFIGPMGMDTGRALLRLAENLLIAVIVLGLRANAVALAERSLVMRTGRVDTQPMIALVGSLALASFGDILHIFFGKVGGIAADLLITFELVVISVGSFLFTLGLVGVAVDVLRLRGVILNPAPGLSDIFSSMEATDGAATGRP